jgi:hypothetical protein
MIFCSQLASPAAKSLTGQCQESDASEYIIQTFGDGRCLFRCAAIALSHELQTAERTILGYPRDSSLRSAEERKADELRRDVVRLLRMNESVLDKTSQDLKFLLDDKIGNEFTSMAERIETVAEETGYVGYLEILALAYLLKRQFKIFVQPPDKPRILQCILPAVSGDSSPICLLYRMDTATQPGHYDFITQHFTDSADFPLVQHDYGLEDDASFTNFLNCALSLSETTTPGGSPPLDSNLTSTHIGQGEGYPAADDVQLSAGADRTMSPIGEACRESTNALSDQDLSRNRNDLHGDGQYPAIWTAQQAEDFKSGNPWLMFSNGCMGCKTCKEVNHFGAFKRQGLKISDAWAACSVTFNGKQRQSQLSSLRKKIYEHAKGHSHTTAEELLKKSGENDLVNVVSGQQKHLHDSTARVFNTVYSLIKNNRPFTDLPSLIALQSMNGADMGLILHSKTTASSIADMIGSQMRSKLCAEIIKSDSKIALIIDESTTISTKSVLILYVRAVVCHQVTSFFLDLAELDGCDADSILTALLNTLNMHGFDDDFLSQHLIAVCSDGASVMTGHKSGVLQKLAVKYPRIILWHCLCHRIELTVSDTLEEVGGINHFKSFMDKLYTVYSLSAKNQRELNNCASVLDVQLKKIGRIFTVRWVASSYRAVMAVHRDYTALHNHFTAASQDLTRDKTQKQQYRGLADTLASEAFILNLGLMIDALKELCNISEELQKDDITLHRAYQLINRTIRAIVNMKEVVPEYVKEAVTGVENGCYRNVSVIGHQTGSRKQCAINRNQFLQSLADNLTNRLCTTIASNTSSKMSDSRNSNKSEFEDLISQVSLLSLQLSSIRLGFHRK